MSTPVTQRQRRTSGQTLIIALIVLGVLLIIGFIFIGVVSRNIQQAGRQQNRSVATDLAEAGIRFAHGQLLNSEQGADWKPAPTVATNASDPDFEWLQANGPDGLGSFTRIPFDNGRALIRVRYAPSDAAIFSNNPAGPVRDPGRVRSYLMIESIGRNGAIRPNDPTTLRQRERNETRKVIAFASIGLIEQARFITNKFNVSRPAEIGVPSDLGITYTPMYDASDIRNLDVRPELQLGQSSQLLNRNGTPSANPVPYGGGLRSNADLAVHGTVNAFLNFALGDMWLVAGNILPVDDRAQLRLRTGEIANGNWNEQTRVLIGSQFDSRSAQFQTFGVLRDGIARTDVNGIPRGVRRLDPPSILRSDPQTGRTRYAVMTRDSGALGPAGNTGKFGHGRGVYVDNASDRQTPVDEGERADAATNSGLVNDWLNPNNGQPKSGWRGPFYVPPGALLQLYNDGFAIIRNAQSDTPNAERTWKRPDGTDTNSSVIRYRIGAFNGEPYIVNTFTPGVDIDANLTAADYGLGQPFNGVIFFEGNVRVRGVIPTELQITVVSNATVYVEGSITKGIRGNDYTALLGGLPNGAILSGAAPRAMLMLMAKDYVAVNTTQFLGLGPGQAATPKPGEDRESVIVSAAAGNLNLRTEILLDPESAPITQPNNWIPFANNYVLPGTTAPLTSDIVFSHAMDESGGNAASFISLDVNPGLTNPNYFFPLDTNNAALPYVGGAGGTYVTYGLGGQAWQRFPKFETLNLPFVTSNATYTAGSFGMVANSTQGNYPLLLQDTNDLLIRTNNLAGAATNDYLLSRAAIVPMDVRIEASVYAEEGSFFVIPGPAFNPNVNDRRDAYNQDVLTYLPEVGGDIELARQRADNERLVQYGAFPGTPFFGEPLDVRVVLVGSVSENMPPPIATQAEWIKRWGWIPRLQGAARALAGSNLVLRQIPIQHFPDRANPLANPDYVPNLVVTYDPVLATGRTDGFATVSDPNSYVRRDAFGRALPPLPRLPVSPTLAYFGEVNP